MGTLADRLLDLNARALLNRLWRRKRGEAKPTPAFYDAPARRREGGQLLPLPPAYERERSIHIAALLAQVDAAGGLRAEHLANPDLARLDERAPEFAAALHRLLRLAPGDEVLDVGCVLNNTVIAPYVTRLARRIWFLNPSQEKLAYASNAAYVLGDMRTSTLDRQFPLVTCLSTLEHVGMDNQRYGGAPGEVAGGAQHPEELACAGLAAISAMVAPDGWLLASVPFGPFEYLYAHGKPGVPIYYTFDAPRLRRLTSCLTGFVVHARVYKAAQGRGWVEASPEDTSIVPYAVGCPGAGAVAIIEAQRAPLGAHHP